MKTDEVSYTVLEIVMLLSTWAWISQVTDFGLAPFVLPLLVFGYWRAGIYYRELLHELELRRFRREIRREMRQRRRTALQIFRVRDTPGN